MPTGSSDPDVLLDWILESMGLIRRRSDSSTSEGQYSVLHRIMSEALLLEPLKGWSSKDLGDITGMSNTGIHHQMVKLRDCGLVSALVEGKWHRHVLRGGSMAAAARLVSAEARAVLSIRLEALSHVIVESDVRMETESEEPRTTFSIRIKENGPREEGNGPISELAKDLGLGGENIRDGDEIASRVLTEMGSSAAPITLLSLSERLSESRGRVATVLDRMRAAGIAERVPMLERIPQDVFSGLSRQYDARGADWLMTRGGLGRLEAGVYQPLLDGAAEGTLDIERVADILKTVPVADQKILLNTLGGRMPMGFRVTGSDYQKVSERPSRLADRTLRRIVSVAERLDSSIREGTK